MSQAADMSAAHDDKLLADILRRYAALSRMEGLVLLLEDTLLLDASVPLDEEDVAALLRNGFQFDDT